MLRVTRHLRRQPPIGGILPPALSLNRSFASEFVAEFGLLKAEDGVPHLRPTLRVYAKFRLLIWEDPGTITRTGVSPAQASARKPASRQRVNGSAWGAFRSGERRIRNRSP